MFGIGIGSKTRTRPAPPVPMVPGCKAALDVLGERNRQVHEEGWDAAHDDRHEAGVLARAAGNYLAAATLGLTLGVVPRAGTPPFAGWLGADWPWALEWWKPDDPRRMLVKAAALILAELERLDRAEAAARGEVA